MYGKHVMSHEQINKSISGPHSVFRLHVGFISVVASILVIRDVLAVGQC